MDHLSNDEALDVYIAARALVETALVAYYAPEREFFQNDLARQFDDLGDLMFRINGRRVHRRGLAERENAFA